MRSDVERSILKAGEVKFRGVEDIQDLRERSINLIRSIQSRSNRDDQLITIRSLRENILLLADQFTNLAKGYDIFAMKQPLSWTINDIHEAKRIQKCILNDKAAASKHLSFCESNVLHLSGLYNTPVDEETISLVLRLTELIVSNPKKEKLCFSYLWSELKHNLYIMDIHIDLLAEYNNYSTQPTNEFVNYEVKQRRKEGEKFSGDPETFAELNVFDFIGSAKRDLKTLRIPPENQARQILLWLKGEAKAKLEPLIDNYVIKTAEETFHMLREYYGRLPNLMLYFIKRHEMIGTIPIDPWNTSIELKDKLFYQQKVLKITTQHINLIDKAEKLFTDLKEHQYDCFFKSNGRLPNNETEWEYCHELAACCVPSGSDYWKCLLNLTNFALKGEGLSPWLKIHDLNLQ